MYDRFICFMRFYKYSAFAMLCQEKHLQEESTFDYANEAPHLPGKSLQNHGRDSIQEISESPCRVV
jgi:hypothetical protein